MGLGLHGGGLAAARWFAKRGAAVTVTDLKDKKTLKSSLDKLKKFNIRYVLGRHEAEDFKKADTVVQNPGVPNESPYLKIAEKFGAEIINEATVFFKYAKSKNLIGITGTKGKSTTSTLVYKILKAKWPDAVLAGNIRDTAMLDAIDKVKKNTPTVLELSSWQLEGLEKTNLSPRLAVITNIYEDHLNRYPSYRAYIKAKENILKFQKKGDAAVLNYDNEILRKLGKGYAENDREIFWFSKNKKVKGAYARNKWIFFNKEKIMSVSKIRIPGEHNLENVLAAVAVAKIMRVPNNIIKKRVAKFGGVTNRLEFVRETGGVKFYNDTTATAPDAAISALKALGNEKKKNIILIAGGMNKKLNYGQMAEKILKYAKVLILFKGSASDEILRELRSENLELRMVIDVSDMKSAVRIAKDNAEKGDIVLLSPGAASFGMFLHEFDRGERFAKAVKALKP